MVSINKKNEKYLVQLLYLAVYGTLKQGYTNYKRYLAPRLPIMEKTMKLQFSMFSNGYYPMVIPSTTKEDIFVEIYEVDLDELLAMDKLEEPYDYHRKTILTEEFSKPIEIYVYNFKTPPTGFHQVKNGNFSSNRDIDDYQVE